MKKSRFTDSQIMSILKQAEAGTPVTELCHEHGMSNASFYKWHSRFGGMDASMMTRLKGVSLDIENYCTIRASPACQRRFYGFCLLVSKIKGSVVDHKIRTPDPLPAKLNFRRKGKQRLPVRNPTLLATPVALNHLWYVELRADLWPKVSDLQVGG